MTIGILGTGMVGQTLGSALIAKGHSVILGSRSKVNEKASKWVETNGPLARQDDFRTAAEESEVIFLCLNGDKAIDALRLAGKASFSRKLVIDVTNPLDFSKGMPPTLIDGLANVHSLGEAIQAELPDAHVVKSLNTVTAALMVAPQTVNGGDHHLFICGNDAASKETAKDLLAREFGWQRANILDLGDISAARSLEAYVTLWVRLMQSQGTPMFNIKIVR